MAGNQINNLMLLDLTTGLPRTIETGVTPDTIQIGTDVELISGGSLTIDGNLVVNGTQTIIDTDHVNVADSHIYLNNGYTTTSARPAGLVANYLPTATNDTVAATGFTAGVPAVSNPTVITTGSATFTAGDIIQISGADDPANNGIFEVDSHIGTTLTVRGIGLTGTTFNFFQDQFVTDTTVAGTITLINASIIRSGTDGIWEVAQDNNTGSLTFEDLLTGTTVTLQQAYVGGNTITTSAAEGNVIIAGTELLQVTATGGVDIDTQFDFDGTVFDVQMTGSNGFSIDGTAASNVSVTAGNLQLQTLTSGVLDLDGVDGITLDTTAGDIDATAGNNAAGAGYAISATAGNSTGGNGAGGAVSLASGDGNGTGNGGDVAVTTGDSGAGATGDAGDFTATLGTALSTNGSGGSFLFTTGDGTGTGTAGLFSVSGPNDEDEPIASFETTGINGDLTQFFVGDSNPNGSITAPASSLFFRDTGAGAELYLNTSTGSGTTWTALSTAAGATLQSAYEAGNTITTSGAEGNITFTGTEDFIVTLSDMDVDTTASITLDADAASNFTVDGGNLTLSTTTSGNLIANSVAQVDIDAGTTVTVNTANAADASANDIVFTSGSSTAGNAAGGDISGTAGDGFGTGNGGGVLFTGGSSGAGATGDGGDVGFTGGNSAATNGNGGDVVLTTGDGTGTGSAGFVSLTGPNDEDEAIAQLTTTGLNGDSVQFFVGDSDPSGAVTGLAGSLFFRDTGATGELYLNTSAGSGTTWAEIATGGSVTLQNAYVGGNTITTSGAEGDVTIGGTEDLVINLSDLLVDTTASISLDADAASNFTVDGGNLTLSTTTSGTVDVTSVNDIQMTFQANNATGMVIDDGTNNFLTFDSTTGDLAIEANQFVDIVGDGAGITLQAAATIAIGDIVTLDSAGDVILADSNTGATLDGLAIGVAATAATSGNPVRIYTVTGTLCQVTFGAAPGAGANSRPVFVSQTAGQGTITAPTGSGNVVFVIGFLQGADGVTTTPEIVLQPQFISVVP